MALAAAEARVGVIPKEAADAIKRLARAEAIDLAKLKAETDLVGYPIVGVVHQLAKQCGEAGRYVHWGATTQDIMDTATVLQIRDALALVEADLAALEAALAALAAQAPRHRDGRPHASAARAARDVRLQGGGVARHDRAPPPAPRRAEARACWSASSRGAAGTLASLGDKGLAVHDALMDELGLGRAAHRPGTSPATAWRRRCRSWRSSPARSPRSPPTSC